MRSPKSGVATVVQRINPSGRFAAGGGARLDDDQQHDAANEKALGQVVRVKASELQVSPGDHFIKICHDELENLMGPVDTSMVFENPRIGPTKIMPASRTAWAKSARSERKP